VMLPMAFRIILPPLTSEFLNIFKNSAVASTIGLVELSRQAMQLQDFTAHAYESFIAVTALYLAVNFGSLLLMRRVEARAKVPGYIGSR
jgi:glutamate/aspartate transport system permease protein